MNWFTATAPIRLKLLIAFGIMAGITAIEPMSLVLGGPVAGITCGVIATLLAIVLGAWFRSAIATPYVTTVVRMEALAAGDLQSPIAHTEFRDCVGRMTKAMFTFRDNARKQIDLNVEAERNSAIVRGMTDNLKRLAQGDLTAEITEDYPASYAELRANFNAALESLRDLIGSVRTSAQTIDTGSIEIARASEDLARRTEANAASLEETTAAVTQMDERLKRTADAAATTVERANGTIGVVQVGREIADDAVRTMGRVSEGAKGIDTVIEGLDKIAFQTRVLAMNAAVEAGRAGEAGRGFAVVADLVSALAMRSEEEAKRAREQLTATQEDIGAAVHAVTRVDSALADIVTDVGQVHALLAGMADDNRAQSSAISEISQAIGAMDRATQQNAAMVEESSAAARNLASEVASLSAEASRFTVEEAAGRRSMTARQALRVV